MSYSPLDLLQQIERNRVNPSLDGVEQQGGDDSTLRERLAQQGAPDGRSVGMILFQGFWALVAVVGLIVWATSG